MTAWCLPCNAFAQNHAQGKNALNMLAFKPIDAPFYNSCLNSWEVAGDVLCKLSEITNVPFVCDEHHFRR